ncbi:thiamine-phosphate kinase [Paenibacillus senegalensis]|uniref:thiamine-phosphate kinase n=1 Tax=Paenibacillus senegalensis TaxID=1465766 RepID=UPI000288E094|nr:thiamine-phosphate kinase [Paenibacillus senegalensis]
MIEEFALIRRLTAKGGRETKPNSPPLTVGIGDDAAVAPLTPGFQMVLACDTMTEEIHFKPITMKPEDVGYKALASNISDMAAMGAVPRYALVALTVSDKVQQQWLDRLYDGLYECAEQYGVSVAGGDVSSTLGGVVISVTIVGEVEADSVLLRSAAKAGDIVAVTGPLGRSAAGLHYLLERRIDADKLLLELEEAYRELVAAHQRPQPRVQAGRLLLRSASRAACNDVSDGLASESWEIAEASGCGIIIEETRLPLTANLQAYAERTGMDPLQWVLYGGEDYELLTCIPADEFSRVEQSFREQGLPLYRIGAVTDEWAGVKLLDKDQQLNPIAKGGYNHFQEKAGETEHA